jgi:hypothetical protein
MAKKIPMRKSTIDKTYCLGLLLVALSLVVGCNGSSSSSSSPSTHAATPTPTPVVSPTSTPTPVVSPTSTSSTSPTPTPTSTSTPIVISTSPAVSGCANQGVPINQNTITVGFNVPMDSTTITGTTTNFTVTGPGTTPIPGNVTYDAANNTAIFTPTNSPQLPASTTITVTITTGVESADLIPLASNFVWTFVTSADTDTTAPTVISTNPANLAPTVATNQKVTAVFSEGMDSTTITGTTFTLTGPGLTPVAGTVTYSAVGATATFTPTSALAAGVLYTATITTGATDQAGNPLAAASTWTFTAGSGPDATIPTVVSMVPAAAATAVAPNAGINATFSNAMDPSTLNPETFTLTVTGSAIPIAGKITYIASGTNGIATFTPTIALTAGTQYTATVTTGVTDLEGNALAANDSWMFTTGSTPSLAPVNFGAASGFQIVAEAGITNTGATMIDGDIGVTPATLTSITGFPPGIVNGTIYAASDAPIVAALASVMTAYNDLAGLPTPTIVPENLAGQVLTPGLYQSTTFSSFEITGGSLTLDAQGDANGVWVFQTPSSTLTLTAGAPSCSVILENGAQFSNVFWQVGSSATVGVGCTLQGNVLAATSITADGPLFGKAYAGAVNPSGAVTLSGGNTVSSAGACNQ